MDISRWISIVILAAAGFGLYSHFHVPSYQKFYRRGLEFYQHADYERASTEFLKAVSEAQEDGTKESRPVMIESFMMAGEILENRLGRYRRALEIYRDVISQAPRRPETIPARIRMAAIHHEKLGEVQKAIQIHRDLLEQWPKDPRVRPLALKLLQAYMTLHDFEQVAAEGQEILRQDPEHPDRASILFLIAESFAIREQWEEAFKTYRRITQDLPQSYYARLALFEMGNCLLKMNRIDSALEIYEQAISSYPNAEVVRERIMEARARKVNEANRDGLPEWSLKSSREPARDVQPKMIEPFPEDRKYPPPKNPQESELPVEEALDTIPRVREKHKDAVQHEPDDASAATREIKKSAETPSSRKKKSDTKSASSKTDAPQTPKKNEPAAPKASGSSKADSTPK